MLNMLPKFELVPMQQILHHVAEVRRPSDACRGDRARLGLEQDDVGGLAGDVGRAVDARCPTSAACSAGASLMPSPR